MGSIGHGIDFIVVFLVVVGLVSSYIHVEGLPRNKRVAGAVILFLVWTAVFIGLLVGYNVRV